MHQDRNEEAIVLLEATCAARSNTQGEDHPDTLRTRCDLAEALVRTRRLAEAVAQYRKAVSYGDARGQLGLARMIEQNRGIEKNLKEAMRLYRLAADQGVREAEEAVDRLGAAR